MTFTPMGNWGNEVSRGDILLLPEPTSLGARHHPIPHERLIQTAERSFDIQGYTLKDWKYYLSSDEQRLLAGFTITRHDIPSYADWSFTGAILTSTNSTVAAKLLFGQNVGICDNGCVWAEYSLSHKHTQNAATNLKYAIMDRIETLTNITDDIHKETEAMKCLPLDDRQVADFIIQSCKNDVLKWQNIPHILNQWDTPDYEEFEPRTQWSLFNAYTHVWKNKNQFELGRKTTKLLSTIHDWNNEEFVGQQTSEELHDDELPI